MRAMGADIVIAVELNADMVGRYFRKPAEATDIKPLTRAGRVGFIVDRLQASLAVMKSGPKSSNALPSVLDVLASSINIVQMHIARSRLAGEPADVLITPRLSHMALLDFHRASPAISEGNRAANAVLSRLTHFLEEQ